MGHTTHVCDTVAFQVFSQVFLGSSSALRVMMLTSQSPSSLPSFIPNAKAISCQKSVFETVQESTRARGTNRVQDAGGAYKHAETTTVMRTGEAATTAAQYRASTAQSYVW